MDSRLNIIAGFKSGESYVKTFTFRFRSEWFLWGREKTITNLSDGDELLAGNSGRRPLPAGGKCGKRRFIQLQSQSYQRLFNMKDKAVQELNVTMEDDTSFAYVPHPVVPHEDSNFKVRPKSMLGKTAS
jgi:urease accessory protein